MKLCVVLCFTVIYFVGIDSKVPVKALYGNYQDPGLPIYLQVGTKSLNDTLLFKQIYQRSAVLFFIREETVQYSISASRISQINAVTIYNYYKSGKATVISGGVGHKYVNILLESNRGQGYSFAVEIYGH